MNKRILLKISGESLMGSSNYGIDVSTINKISNEIKNVYKKKYQICLIIGGGNIFRGISALVEPLMGIFDLFGGFLKGFLRSFTRIIEPFGRLFERLQPLLISLGALLQSLLMVFNSIFEFVGNLFDQVINFFDPEYADKVRANEWDDAAGQAIAEHAGAIVTTLDEELFKYGKKDYKNPTILIRRSKNLNV